MKIFKTLSLSILFASVALHPASLRAVSYSVNYAETPARTVFFKNPGAKDATKFFATGTTFTFEIYKAGSKEEVANIVAALKNDADVENVYPGVITGDFQAFTLILKAPKSKEWFVSEFKKAGLATIKINNNPVVDVDKI